MIDHRPHRRRLSALVGFALCATAAGCYPAAGPPLPPQTGAAGSWSDLSARIFVPRCATAGCHGGNPPAVPPTFDADASWAALVGVTSTQAPSLRYVEPGRPDQSYLVAKLRGTAAAVGGSGNRMPPNDAPVSDEDIAQVEAWILNGALND